MYQGNSRGGFGGGRGRGRGGRQNNYAHYGASGFAGGNNFEGDDDYTNDNFHMYDNMYEAPDNSGGGGGRRGKGGRERPPPNLRGRAIGMWYAARSRGRDGKPKPPPQDDIEQMLTLMLPSSIEEDVDGLLKMIEKPVRGLEQGWPGIRQDGTSGHSHYVDRYNHVKQSDFKVKFMENLKQNELVASDGTNRMECGESATGLSGNDLLDTRFLSELKKKQLSNPEYKKMMEFRKKLPAFEMRKNVLECIEKNQVVVLSGETGCGKTTQVPQFILDSYIEQGKGSECRILCTQPRRISAISVAERVSQERGESCGESAGYQIRLQARMPRDRGSILYCTTGILVTRLQSDPLMSEYSHVVLDEIHERDVLSDFLLALVKDILPLRPTLKLVLMSATLNAELFSQYFGGCPMLHIPGLTFPVEEFYLEDVLALTGVRVSNDGGGGGGRGGGGGFRGNFKKKNASKVEAAKYKMEMVPKIKELNKGKRYPGHVMSSLESPNCENPDYIQEFALETIRYICEKEGEGAILVFFPGWEDISKLHKSIEEDSYFRTGSFLILPLHSLMPTVNQKQVFDRPPRGTRKIIIATNIAETSITIDDVVFVIDSGKIKMNTFDTELNVQTLKPEWVARANARQRKGRAGRVQPGKCYHLFSRARESTFADFPLPEMKRMRLEELCLQIKLLKLGLIDPFLSKVIEPPTPRALKLSIELLRDLNALDEAENLTPLGFHLARLPTDPQTGKMLLMAAIFSCVDPISTIAASLSFKDPFFTPLGKERDVARCKLEFAEDMKSDHLMMVKVYQAWEEVKAKGWNEERRFCHQNFLSGNTLGMLRDMKKQLCGYLKEMDFIWSPDPKDKRSNANSQKMALVRAVVCAGLYPNVAFARVKRSGRPGRVGPPAMMRTPQDNQKVVFHPKSVLADERDFPSPWIVYKLKQKTTNVSIFDATIASPCSLLFFGQEVKSKPVPKMGKNTKVPRNQQVLSADKHIKFKSSERIAHAIQSFRACLDDLLDYKITHPGPTVWDPSTKEGALLRAIVELLTAEAELSGLNYADDFDDEDSDNDFDGDFQYSNSGRGRGGPGGRRDRIPF